LRLNGKGYNRISCNLDMVSAMTKNARLYLTISKELDRQFREEIVRRLGMKKGNLQLAIEEAIELWLKSKNR